MCLVSAVTSQQPEEPKVLELPRISCNSHVEVDITHAFDFSQLNRIENIEFTQSIGKVEWLYNDSAEVWKFPRFKEFRLITLPDHSTCLYSGFDGGNGFIGDANTPFMEEYQYHKMSLTEWASLRAYTIWGFQKGKSRNGRVSSIIQDNGKLKFLSFEFHPSFEIPQSSKRYDYDIVAQSVNSELIHFFYYKTSDKLGEYHGNFVTRIIRKKNKLFETSKISFFKEESQKIIQVNCFFQEKLIYCWVNHKNTQGELKYSFLKSEIKDQEYFQPIYEIPNLKRGFVYHNENPSIIGSKDSQIYIEVDELNQRIEYCILDPQLFKIEDYNTYKNNCRFIPVGLKLRTNQYFSEVDAVNDYVMVKLRTIGKINEDRTLTYLANTKLGIPARSLEDDKYKRYGLIKDKHLFYVDLSPQKSIPTKGFLNSYLSWKMQKPIVLSGYFSESVKVIIKASEEDQRYYKEVNFMINLVKYNYKPRFERPFGASFVYRIPNSILYHDFWYQPLFCEGDFFSFGYDTLHKHKIEMKSYYLTYRPEYRFLNEGRIKRGGCKIPDTPAGVITGHTCLKFESEKMNVMLNFELGRATSLTFTKFQENDQEFSYPLSIDIRKYKIKVKRARGDEQTSLFYIESTEHSNGYIIKFNINKPKELYLIRALEGIENPHFFSDKGHFTLRSSNILIFSYFEDNEKSNRESTLDYSLYISFNKCYLSVKSNTSSGTSNEAKLWMIYPERTILHQGLTIKTEENVENFTLKPKKKKIIESKKELEEFTISLTNFFKGTGNKVVIDNQLTNHFDLNLVFKMDVDTQIKKYKLTKLKGDIQKIVKLKDSEGDLSAIVSVDSSYTSISLFSKGVFVSTIIKTKRVVLNFKLTTCTIKGTPNLLCGAGLYAKENQYNYPAFFTWNSKTNELNEHMAPFKFTFEILETNVQRDFKFMIGHTSTKGGFQIFRCDFADNCIFEIEYSIPYGKKTVAILNGLINENDVFLFFSKGKSIYEIRGVILVNDKFEKLEVDSLEFVKFIHKNCNMLIAQRIRYDKKTNEATLLVDGNFNSFFIFKFKIEIETTPKLKVKFKEYSVDRYYMPKSSPNLSYVITKNFIALSSISVPMRKYLDYGSTKIGAVIVWARRDGKFKGDGYSYRIQSIKNFDPSSNLMIEDYNNDIISFLKDKSSKGVLTYKLENKIDIVKKKSKKKYDIADFDLKFRGNYWSFSDVEIKAENFIELKKEEKIEEDDETTVIFIILFCVIGALCIGLLVLLWFICSIRKHKELNFNTEIDYELKGEGIEDELDLKDLNNSLIGSHYEEE